MAESETTTSIKNTSDQEVASSQEQVNVSGEETSSLLLQPGMEETVLVVDNPTETVIEEMTTLDFEETTEGVSEAENAFKEAEATRIGKANEDDGSNTGLIIALVAATVAVGGAVAGVVVMRKKKIK